VDARADQFALAAMTYEMLAGRRPFSGDNQLAVLYAISHHEPAPLASLARDVPAPVETVVHRALAKDKEQRFISVVEFSQALARSATGAPDAAAARPRQDAIATVVPADSGARTPSSAPRSRSRAVVLAAAGVGLLAFAAFALSRGSPAAPPPAPVNAAVAPRPAQPAPAPPPTAPAPTAAPEPAMHRSAAIARRRPPVQTALAPDAGAAHGVDLAKSRHRREIDREIDLDQGKRRAIDKSLGENP
jgi:serine/threonine-protein kinase